MFAWRLLVITSLLPTYVQTEFPLRTDPHPKEWKITEINDGLPYRQEKGVVHVIAWERIEDDRPSKLTQILVLKKFDKPLEESGHSWLLAVLYLQTGSESRRWRGRMINLAPPGPGETVPEMTDPQSFGYEFHNEPPNDKLIQRFLFQSGWTPDLGTRKWLGGPEGRTITTRLSAGGIDRVLWKKIFNRDVPTKLFPELKISSAVRSDEAPPVIPIDKAAVATISLKGYPDFLEIGFGSVWVSNPGTGTVQRIDAKTDKVIAEVKVNGPCAAMAVGYDSLWVASCKDKTIVRINGKSNTITATIPITVANSEASLAAGEGGIWVLTDKKGVLSRIDPETNKVVAQIPVKPNSFAAMAGHGAIWITNTGEPRTKDKGSVQRIDPKTNAVTATIPVGVQPRFLAVGEGAVWVLNQMDGTVSRIDPKTNEIAATIDAGVPGLGGDIAAGEGAVWVRANKVLLLAIDPKTNQVVKRFGPPAGSGAVRAGDGAVWVSAHDVNKVWRLDPRKLP
jgi:YVTN family beta-propeller protein